MPSSENLSASSFARTYNIKYVERRFINEWATCNVGVESPEDYGYCYAWGETESKETYTWRGYFDSVDGSYKIFKKCYIGGVRELDLEDDAAYVN